MKKNDDKDNLQIRFDMTADGNFTTIIHSISISSPNLSLLLFFPGSSNIFFAFTCSSSSTAYPFNYHIVIITIEFKSSQALTAANKIATKIMDNKFDPIKKMELRRKNDQKKLHKQTNGDKRTERPRILA